MDKSESSAPQISHITLLTYSTWLVAGAWLIFTGAWLILNPPNTEQWFFNYFFGAIRLFTGVHALRSAGTVARRTNEPQKSTSWLMTSVLLTMMVVLPLLMFIIQTSMMTFGTYQPGESYRENLVRLISIAAGYLFATIYADWRLRKQ